MVNHLYSQTWELDSLFPGGSSSPQLIQAFEQLSLAINHLGSTLNEEELDKNILSLQEIESRLMELDSFISCLIAQNTSDQQALQWDERLASLKAEADDIRARLDALLGELSEAEFEKLLKHKQLEPLTFVLKERRDWSKQKLDPEREEIITQLSLDGYQGWHGLYRTWMGTMRIPIKEEEKVKEFSIGQIESQLSHPNAERRQFLFKEWEQTWQLQEQGFARLLNHLGGFRLNVYKLRGWTDILKEPLFYNRMQKETLETMWQAIQQFKPVLLPYLLKKAELLGLSQLAWYDIEAPLPSHSLSSVPFQKASEAIVDQFHRFSPKMGQFAKKALQEKWVEAEDRSGKLPGGFCSQHPESKQSRIFMTYSGQMMNIFTLAHELGHAYHNYATRELPYFNQQYRMNVAETASTLAEMIFIDSLIRETQDAKVKQALLDSKLQRAVLFLMNIHARYLFETRFYEEKRKGYVTASDLNQLMETAQQEAYLFSLVSWHPHFWVAKGHFYMTDVPFYNFPYTFGYLFSLGIYVQGQQQGKEFENHYEALLQDTGRMNVEDLAQKHLHADLTQLNFWQTALKSIEQDVQEYIHLK